MPSSKHLSQHWYFDANSFEPSSAQLNLLLDILPSETKAKVTKYRALKDQKLSLVSALIQRAMIRDTFNCSDEDYTIKRTSFNKPFATSESLSILDWNYNVSHHGSYVTILSDSTRPMGVDLVQRKVRKSWKHGADKYISQFTSQLTASEIADCLQYSTEWEKYTHFFVIWSLKEAYIKAVGKGLYMDLLSVSFKVKFQSLSLEEVSGAASAKINHRESPDWDFTFTSLDSEHVVSVARGPDDTAVEVTIDTLQCKEGACLVTDIAATQVHILDLLCHDDQLRWKKVEEEEQTMKKVTRVAQ
jgi:4'-phosphopantetheinyl transferase